MPTSKNLSYLLLVKIHQHALRDEDKLRIGMSAAQVVHPVGFQQGRRDIDIARQYLFLGILQLPLAPGGQYGFFIRFSVHLRICSHPFAKKHTPFSQKACALLRERVGVFQGK